MKLHERERQTNEAKRALSKAISDIVIKHELTDGESLRIVNAALTEYIGGTAKYMIREERHPGEPDREGGLE